MTNEQRIDKVTEAINNSNDYSLIEKLETVSLFNKESDFNNYVLILLALIEKSRFHETASSLLIKKIYDQKIFSAGKTPRDYGKFFIKTVRQSAIKPYVNIATTLRRLLATIIYNENPNELKTIVSMTPRELLLETNEYLLEKYLNDNDFDNNSLLLYYTCYADINKETNEVTISNAANKLLRNKLDEPRNFIAYLKGFIRPRFSSFTPGFSGEFQYVPEPFYLQIFFSRTQFMTRLSQTIASGDPDVEALQAEVEKFMIRFYKNEGMQKPYVEIPEQVSLNLKLHLNIKPSIHSRKHTPKSEFISPNEEWEMAYWEQTFGVTREALVEAIEAVGHKIENLERYFEKHQ